MPKPKSLLKKRGKMVSPYQTAVFTLGDRHSVVDFMGAEPLLPSILASEGRFVSFPELFRSVQQHLIACALAEFEFEVQFFNVEDSALFIDVFGGACELLHLGAVEWIRGSYDIVGMLLFCVLLQGAVERLAKEGVPILQEFFLKWVRAAGLSVVCARRACSGSRSCWRCRCAWAWRRRVRRRA